VHDPEDENTVILLMSRTTHPMTVLHPRRLISSATLLGGS